MKNKYLALLHAIAPLSKKSQYLVWKNIKVDLEINLLNKSRKTIKKIIKLWYALVLVFLSAILIPLTPSATTIIDGESTGWEATLAGNELEVKAINPMVVGKTQVCVLWVKHDNKITKIAKLPDNGTKYISLKKEVVDKLNKDSVVMISIEEKGLITLPSKIEYRRQL